MKYPICIFLVFLAALFGCNQSSTVAETHTHEGECAETHEGNDEPATQETFEVTAESLLAETDSTEANGQKHDHGDCSHTH